MRTSLFAAFGLLAGLALPAQVSEETPGWFAFGMSAVDSLAGTPVDVSFLNSGPAARRVAVRDGRFVDEGGARLRFIGTNATFSGAFPEKAMATLLADRMGQLGFNVVRFHHMDARDIWLPDQAGLDPEKLDRLDWFIAELKRNGIYTNLNLHVSRTYPGLAKMTPERAFRYGKIVDKFHDPYIVLQEEYASALLDRVNPYTGMKLTEDPAVAFVELNNENTLLHLDGASLAVLPDLLRESLAGKWRAWLGGRYASLDELRGAWTGKLVPLGEEMLANGNFAGEGEGWTLEGSKPGVCDLRFAATPEGAPCARIEMTEKGRVAWAYQLHQIGLVFAEGTPYTLRFRGRAEPARRISISLRFAEPPWTNLSRSINLQLTPEWQEFELSSDAQGVRPELKQRLSFNLGDEPGVAEFAAVSLRPGNPPLELGPEVRTLHDLPLPREIWPAQAWTDFRRFLIATERDYMTRLKRHLVDRLGVKSLIVDSQASYGNLWGLHREATIGDYIDMHAYWQHPVFPGKPWDGGNWTIGNTSMVAAEPGRSTFERLASYRLAGRPFSVSEYNHPAPNDHACELFPLLAAYAGHQDWDALYQFTYGNHAEAYTNPKINGYFSLCHHSGQLAFAPLAALAFRLGLIPPASATAVLTIPEPYLARTVENGYLAPDTLVGDGVFSREHQTTARFAVQFSPEDGEPSLATTPGTGTDAVVWQRGGERPRLLVNAPAARFAVGEIGGETLHLADLELTARPTDGTWACFGLVAADGKPLAESGRALLALASRVENSNMGWDEARKTVGKNWGTDPVVAQGVAAEVVLPGAARPRVTALGPDGKPGAAVPVTGGPGAWRVALGPEFKTLWYAIER